MKNQKVCVATSTRADYGIMKPLLTRLLDCKKIDLQLVATGMHLCHEFGNTVREIENDGIPIFKKIDLQLNNDTAAGMSKAMSLALTGFADYFNDEVPDMLVVLGDRYEIAAVCCAALNQRIPIAHIHGGELTAGAVDDCYRHAITKMSRLHFTSCEPYRQRVIKLGEDPATVFNVGAMGVENILTQPEVNIAIAVKEPYAVVTFHPVTTEHDLGIAQLKALMNAMDQMTVLDFIITGANADAGGREINHLWSTYCKNKENCHLVASLGSKRYISALKKAKMMIGNSSSGIMEGPACKIPVVNIGNRQKGRISPPSVLHCEPNAWEIKNAMKKALTETFQTFAKQAENPYGDGNTSQKIADIILDFLSKEHNKEKIFYE